MTALSAGKDAMAAAGGAQRYARHRPEQTLLYRLVEQHYPAFLAPGAAGGGRLPTYVRAASSRIISPVVLWSTAS